MNTINIINQLINILSNYLNSKLGFRVLHYYLFFNLWLAILNNIYISFSLKNTVNNLSINSSIDFL